MLYPDLFESNEFIVGLLNINVKTENGEVNTDYYTYLTKYKKKNWLTLPFQKVMYKIKNLFSSSKVAFAFEFSSTFAFRSSNEIIN